MYDLDVPTVLERLKKIPNATSLCSNPCVELWILLHYANQQTELTSKGCVEKLCAIVPTYRKGTISKAIELDLLQCMPQAIERAEKLVPYANPSTTVFEFIKALEQ